MASPGEALRELRLLGEAGQEDGEWPRYFVGTPETVRAKWEGMARALGIGELVVNTITWDHAARLRSYGLLAGVFGMIGIEADQALSSTQVFCMHAG